jgi:DNA-binding Xre family transcriptional regulator
MSKNRYSGSNFDNFFKKEEELLNKHSDQNDPLEVEAMAIKRVLADRLKQLMNKRSLSKTDLAKSMHTSRAALDRLLDQNNTSVTLHSIVKVARSLNKKVAINLH